MNSPRSLFVAAAATTALVGVGTFAVATHGLTGTPSASASISSAAHGGVGARQLRAAARGYSALNNPSPKALRHSDKPRSLEWVAARQPGLDIESAAILEDTAQTTVAVVPAAGGDLCAVRLTATGAALTNCVDTDQAVEKGVVSNIPGRVTGIVPDGVSELTFTLEDGSTVTKPVTDNTFQAPPTAVSATFERDGQTERIANLLPASALGPNDVLPPQ